MTILHRFLCIAQGFGYGAAFGIWLAHGDPRSGLTAIAAGLVCGGTALLTPLPDETD